MQYSNMILMVSFSFLITYILKAQKANWEKSIETKGVVNANQRVRFNEKSNSWVRTERKLVSALNVVLQRVGY